MRSFSTELIFSLPTLQHQQNVVLKMTTAARPEPLNQKVALPYKELLVDLGVTISIPKSLVSTLKYMCLGIC